MGDLIQFDEWLFRLINVEWHNSLLDYLMPLWRNKLFWAPIYLFLLSFILINYGRKAWLWILALVVVVTLGDTISSQLIKKSVQRYRPCHAVNFQPDYQVRIKCGSGYSFPSSHATNHFAVALFILLTLGRSFGFIKIPLLLWAFSIAYGQVYVGVHFPLDVIGGALLGIVIGTFMAIVYDKTSRRIGWEIF